MTETQASYLARRHEPFLRIFPPQVTVGEQVIARVESASWNSVNSGPQECSTWNLECAGSPLGRAASYLDEIPFQIDEPGPKKLVATAIIAGAGVIAIAQADLIVHREVGEEIDAIVNEIDVYNSYRWFRSIVQRYPNDLGYKEKIDLILCSHLNSPEASTRETAFELSCRLQEPAWRKVAASYLRADSHAIEDVIQETRRRTWRSLTCLRPGTRFGAWAYATLINSCRDAKRSASAILEEPGKELASKDRNVEIIEAIESHDHLTRGIEDGDLELLKLRFCEEMSYIDIAHRLNIRPGSPDSTRVTVVSRRVSKLVKDLRESRSSELGRDWEGGFR